MGRIVVMMSVSLDGYFEGPNRELDWHLVDEELHEHFNEELSGMSRFLHGRVTYELMAAYWPTADADPSNSAAEAEFARIWRDTPKVVYSTTLQTAGWNTTIRRHVDVDEITELRRRPGGDMVVGGSDLAATFRRLDLIDEYRTYVHPVLIGRGRPFFPPSDGTTALRLAETRTFGNGVVLLRHERAGGREGKHGSEPSVDDRVRAATVGAVSPHRGPITLVDHDPGWAVLYEREASRLRAVLGRRLLAVEHVGSTSVPGLVAKPVVDLVAIVADCADEDAYLPALAAAGYVLRIREPDWYEHRLFKGPDTNINLHLFSDGCAEFDRMVRFRDRLRADQEDRARYEARKRELANRTWEHVQGYADAKGALIDEIIARAG